MGSKKKGPKKGPTAADQQQDSSRKPDLYTVLGLERSCSQEDIKRAYRTLALKHHPDKPGGDHETFTQITQAFSILSDPGKRKYYDEHGSEGLEMIDMPAEECIKMFQVMVMEMVGGAREIKRMLRGLTKADLRRLPPFPFPKELFPPGTFPEGMRFSTEGLKGMPPALEELLAGGQGSQLHDLMAGGTSPPRGPASGKHHHHHHRPGGFPPGAFPPGAFPPGAFPPFFDDFGSEEDEDEEDGWTTASDEELEGLGMDGEHGEEGEGSSGSDDDHSEGSSQRGSQGAGLSSSRQGVGVGIQQAAGSSGAGSAASSAAAASRTSGQPSVPNPGQQLDPLLVRDWIAAAKTCDISLMQVLLSSKPALLEARAAGLGHTALHWCAARGDEGAVRWLLGCGANPAARNNAGSTPLHAAARNGALGAARALLDTGLSQPEAADEDGCTAEALALQYKHVELVALLQQQRRAGGAWAAGAAGQAAASAPAAASSSPAPAPAPAPAATAAPPAAEGPVLGSAHAGSQVQSRPTTCGPAAPARPQSLPSAAAAPAPKQPAEGAATKGRAAPGDSGSSAQAPAAQAGPASAKAEASTSSRASANHSSSGPAASTSKGPAGSTGSKLGGGGGSSSNGADAKARMREALLAAEREAEEKEARKEAERVAAAAAAEAACGVPKEQGRAWLEAAKAGDIRTMHQLLASNPRLLHYKGQGTSLSFTGHSALHWAASKGQVPTVQWLLAQGADTTLPNSAGATALHAALANNRWDVAYSLVLEGGASCQLADELGETPRDVALRKTSAEQVAQLDLAARVLELKSQEPSQWALRAMRSLLAAAKVQEARGAVERGELVALCQKVLVRYPGRIVPVAAAPAAAPAPAPAPAGAAGGVAAGMGSAGSGAPPSGQPAAVDQQQGSEGQAPKQRGGQVGGEQAPPSASPPASEDGEDEEESEGEEESSNLALQVEAARLKGNEAFRSKEYSRAVSHYSMALRLAAGQPPDSLAVLYSNRAAAYAGMQYYGKSLEDAEQVIKLQPSLPKGHSRKGTALLGMGQAREAVSAFGEALRLDPGNEVAADGLRSAKAALQRTHSN